MKDVQFKQTRKALQSKQRDLKRKGKGNKANASVALSEEDIQVLYEKEKKEGKIVCCAEQREMSSKGLQSLRRKATRGNENRRCTVLLSSKQCKIWLR